MTLRPKQKRAARFGGFVFSVALVGLTALVAHTQQPAPFPFRATHYDVEATLHPADQTLTAQAKVDFVASSAGRTLTVELHPDLRVSAVLSSGGRKLSFQRDADKPLLLEILLPSAAQPGDHVTLTFTYSGAFTNDDDSPTKGVRFASIDKDSAYLLLPARWFPLTDFPSNRYTATFKINVPGAFAVVGTGRSEAPSIAPAKGAGAAEYTFVADQPAPVGTFVAGNLQLFPVQAEGLTISVFAPPAASGTAVSYGDTLASIVNYFSGEFGPLRNPNLTLAQMPDGSLSGFAAPGLVLLSARNWTNKVNARVLAHFAAEQWWGDEVLPATPNDVWISDGLARYAEGLYAEDKEGTEGFHQALTDFAVGALMYEDAAPISQAERLGSYSDQYRSVVVDKGAMVLHMLRSEMGDAAFASLLKDFYAKYAGQSASIADFEKMTQLKLPPPGQGQPALNLTAFFSQWLDSTGIPQFKMDYIVYRTPKGFKVVGKIEQDLETFNMPVEVRVETEGNPVTKLINVVGTSTEFEIDTFGRPKPNGITIDPDNDLLKSSAKLRVRALVARGEGLAERGKFYEAIQQYQAALNLQPNNSLASFRMGEAFFYQKNWQAAANSFRAALDGDLDPSYKWVEVWSHIYLGKIFDVLGQRERAVNEYAKAQQLKDDTDGAQAEAARYLNNPYTDTSSSPSGNS